MHQDDPKPSANHRLLALLRPYRWPIAGALASLLCLTAVNLATPLLVGTVFNRVFPERDWTLLGAVLFGLFALYLLRNVFFYHSKFTAVRVGENVCFQLRRSLFEKLQQLSLSYTRTRNPGKLSSKVMNDSLQIQQFIQDVLPKFLQSALLFGGILIIIYVINWQLALAATFVLPLHFIVFRFFGKRIKGASRQSQENVDFAAGNIIETLLGVEVVKGFTGEDRGSEAFREAMENSRASQLRSYRYVVLQKVTADLLVGLGMLALIGIGAYQVIGRPEGHAMKAGDFIAFFWYIRLLYPTVIDLMSSGAKLSKVGASVERAFELFAVDDIDASGAGRTVAPIRGDLEFQNVDFSFDGEQPTLEGISFRVDAGQVCAVTGHSGAGKSTLVSMVPLLLKPDSGVIRIDGHDSRDIDSHELRRHIGVVFQECFLFNTTILENLRYARPSATGAEIETICRKTGAHDFIERLPRGYQTVVGEEGVSLSRGQKQLVTISRAVLKNPSILILDEATASLDSRRETNVIPTILELMQGRTTLMITHNPQLMRHADLELTLEHGRVASFAPLKKTRARKKAGPRGAAKGAANAVALGALAAGLALGAATPADAAPEGQGDQVRLVDLESERVRLSYTDPQRCLKMLQVYGVATGRPGKTVDPKNLPVVVRVPPTQAHKSIPKVNQSFPLTEADPVNELIVFYNPSEPDQLSRVTRIIREKIDVPARQIMIEAMVLEISETGLDRLGVEWSLDSPDSTFDRLDLGNVDPLNQSAQPEGQLKIGAPGVFGEFEVTLRSLVTKGQAEVLSRPSVLTLNNRMAYINVSREIPFAETKFQGNQSISTVSFREKTVGIQLGVRPRINDRGKEVSMQVNASVSSRVPGEDVEVRTDDGDRVAAVAPTISVREVKTYARIANNTPFIIGGLITRDDLREQQRVPILGELPLIGGLFGSSEADRLKREVIIVITPYVLPEDESRTKAREKIVGRFLPKGEDIFDSFGNELYRDAYRIRDEDVFQLDFLVGNEQLRELQRKVREVVGYNEELSEKYPFSSFASGRIPGEQILVYRQMYEVIKRTGIDEGVEPGRVIFFEPNASENDAFSVTFLDAFLKNRAEKLGADAKRLDNRGMEAVWPAFEGKAVALTYRDVGSESEVATALSQPVPEISVHDAPDDETYDELLWRLNQPDDQGRARHTILIQNRDHLKRLRRAIVLRDTVDLNAVERTLTLDNFSVGRYLLLPTKPGERINLIDGEVAKLFFYTERYYDALRKRLREDSAALRTVLESVGGLEGEASPDPAKLREALRKVAPPPTLKAPDKADSATSETTG